MAAESAPLRLTRLRVKNFRSIRELDIPLGPLTVLVGPNGSGKSNVLDALRFMRDCLTRGVEQAVLDRKGGQALRYWTSEGGAAEISFGVTTVDINGTTVAYDFVLIAEGKTGFRVQQEAISIQVPGQSDLHFSQQGPTARLTWNGQQYTSQVLSGRRGGLKTQLLTPTSMVDDAGSTSFEGFDTGSLFGLTGKSNEYFWDAYTAAWMLERVVGGALIYALPPGEMRTPQSITYSVPFEENGQNLGAVLRELLNDPYTAETVRLTLQRLVTGVTSASVESAGSYLVTYLHYDTLSGPPRPADLGQESDGTLRALAILAALFQPEEKEEIPASAYEPHDLLAFEEPELHIHPDMLAVLAELFVTESRRKQILLTTHSPDLLDYLPPESFLVVERIDGETRVGPLAADQVKTIRQKLFTPGELLRMEGLHRQPEPAENPAPTAS